MKKVEYIKIAPDKLDNNIISKAKIVLKNGGIVALPTETVYGLVADLFSYEAVGKIYEIKGREFSKPLPLFVPDIESVALYVEKLPDFAYKLMDAFWPGPLTVVLFKKKGLDIPFKTSTLGLRIPNHPVPLALLKECGPLVSTSANLSGGKDALSAEEVKDYFNGEIDLILDAGPTILRIPSTVIDCTGRSPKIIREGKIKKEEIEEIISTQGAERSILK
jgi:L-threonylcarbamoyladenylate synthase